MRKVVLVTGASSGVGLSLAKYLSSRYEVIAVARRIDKMKEELRDRSKITIRQADLSKTNDVLDLVAWLKSEFGHVPYVINNAGVNIRGGVEALSLEEVNHCVAVNALAPFLILNGLIPAMKANNFGRVINVTSGAPLNCFPEFAAYSASKGALNALTVTCAKECADLNIRVNLMSPGPVRTEMAPNATMDASACHPTVDYLLGLDQHGPTGKFFWLGYEIPMFPDLSGIDWLGGKADSRIRRVIGETA